MTLSIQPTKEDEPTKSEVKNELNLAKTNLKGDWPNIFLLLMFYIMQGLPTGLATAISILLQSKKNITYNDQVNMFDILLSNIVKLLYCKSGNMFIFRLYLGWSRGRLA